MRHFVILLVLVLISTLIVYFGVSAIGLLPEPASLQAETIDWLFNVEFIAI